MCRHDEHRQVAYLMYKSLSGGDYPLQAAHAISIRFLYRQSHLFYEKKA